MPLSSQKGKLSCNKSLRLRLYIRVFSLECEDKDGSDPGAEQRWVKYNMYGALNNYFT